MIIEKSDVEPILSKIEENLTNCGKIFKEYDVHLYLGVIRFYCGQYE